MREEKKWLSHGKWLGHFSFGCKTYKRHRGAKVGQNTPPAHSR